MPPELPDSAIQLAATLNGPEGPSELARQLKATQDDTKLDRAVTDLARGIAASKNYGAAAMLVDNLTAQPDLRSSVIAGSLLWSIINHVEIGNYSATKDILTYPDALCERAAKLLDHPDPVVQALGEWALALRVKKQARSAKDLKQFFQRYSNPQDWYRKWKARSAQFDLQDDYARQLIAMGRHYSTAGIGVAVERTAARMAKLAADPAEQAIGSNPPGL